MDTLVAIIKPIIGECYADAQLEVSFEVVSQRPPYVPDTEVPGTSGWCSQSCTVRLLDELESRRRERKEEVKGEKLGVGVGVGGGDLRRETEKMGGSVGSRRMGRGEGK